MKPLAIDLYCGLGGWTEGLMAEGYRVVGFDNERHVYGDHSYPAQLVLQDVLTIHGSQFKNASLIVASPPCQEYSYMAMPWSRAKQIAREYENGERDKAQLTALFDACFRIQQEAIEAAGRFIPLVVENVKGAQSWVGRAKWHHGSFYLWGDVPALMPITTAGLKAPKGSLAQPLTASGAKQLSPHWRNKTYLDGMKNNGGSWFNIGSPGQKELNCNPVNQFCVTEDGVKGFTPNNQPRGKNTLGRRYGSKSPARKAASAMIAKIPIALSRHIAAAWYPR